MHTIRPQRIAGKTIADDSTSHRWITHSCRRHPALKCAGWGELLACALWLLSFTVSQGQEASSKASIATVAQLTPNETVAAITLRPQQIAAGERMQMAPLEVLTAAGLEQVGIDPLQIVRADLLIPIPGPAGPQGGLIVQLAKPFDISDLNAQWLDEQGLHREGDFEFLSDSSGDFVVHQYQPQVVVIGTKIFVKQMLSKRTQPGKVASLLEQVKVEHDGLAIVSISTLQPLLLGMLDRPLRDLPPDVADDINAIVQATDFAAIGLSIANQERLQLVLAGAGSGNADILEQRLAHVLQATSQTFVTDFKRQFSDPGPTAEAMRSYIDRISGTLTNKLTPVRRGNALVIELDQFQQIGTIGTLTGLLLPAVQAARQAARRTQSSNNLKQIGLAFHNFHDAYGAFPAAGGVGDDGKPMLSWRVALLPFVEQGNLYNRFHLDEPWDSEHNIKLLEEMPAVYKHPDRATQAGHTVYQAVVSEDSAIRATEPTNLGQITDGSSNTILVVETNSIAAVPWTAPQDFAVDAEQPGKNLFTNGMTQATFADGSVRVLAESVAIELLKAFFTRAGGERIPNR
jgi:hypothetical protein